MAEFTYWGVDKFGNKVTGKIEVPNEGELRMLLRNQGIRPIKISKMSLLGKDLANILGGGGVGPLPLAALAPFTGHLHVLISSGIPLVQSLEILYEQTTDKNLKKILHGVKEKVSQGSYLWEALSTYPRAFPQIFLALIRAGESAGAIDVMLKRLTRYLEDADRMRRMVKSAMIYPIAVIGISIGVILIMLIAVIPKIKDFLSQTGQELPYATQVIIDVSNFLVNNIFSVIAVIVFSIFFGIRFFQSKEGQSLYQKVLFRAPIFGLIMQKSGVARFCRTMSTLLGAGVNLLDAIDICRASVDNIVIEGSVRKIRREVEGGKPLGTVMRTMPVFPKMAVQMISIGESTGNLDKMMDRVADFYEQEVEILISGLSRLIEPIILVILGAVVGGILVAMYLPIFKMASGVGE